MAVKGGFYFNIGNKKLPVGKGSLKEIKKAFISEKAADLRKEYLESNKNYDKKKYILTLSSNGFKQPKVDEKAKVVLKRKLDKIDETIRKNKYFLVSTIFFRLVARTPIDEDYWTKEKDNRIKPLELEDIYYYKTDPKTGRQVMTKRSQKSISYHEKGLRNRFHKADDKRIRDEWYIKLGSFKIRFCSTDFNIDYDAAFEEGIPHASQSVITKIAKEMGALDNYPDFEDYEIWNASPYFRTLEFGEYNNKSKAENSWIGKGAKRFHGTNEGYSVQAPLGLLGRTLAEFSELERLSKKNGKDEIVKEYGKRKITHFALSRDSDVEKKFQPLNLEIKVIDGVRETTNFYLEDLINQVCENKYKMQLKTVDLPISKQTPEEIEEEFNVLRDKRRHSRWYEKEKEAFETIKKANKEYKDYKVRQIRQTTEYEEYLSKNKKARKKENKVKEYKITGNICNEVRETNYADLYKLKHESYIVENGDIDFDPEEELPDNFIGYELVTDDNVLKIEVITKFKMVLGQKMPVTESLESYARKNIKDTRARQDFIILSKRLVNNAIKSGLLDSDSKYYE